MANIAKFESLYTSAVSAVILRDEASETECVEALALVSDAARPKAFRGVSAETIGASCRKAAAAIREHEGLGDGEVLSYAYDSDSENEGIFLRHSADNRTGSDFDFFDAESKSWSSVELKLGAATDAAAGFKVVNNQIVPVPEPLDFLESMRTERIRMWQDGEKSEALKIKSEAISKAVEANSAYLGKKLPEAAQKRLDAYHRGITISSEDADSNRRISRMKASSPTSFSFDEMPQDSPSDWVLAYFDVSRAGRLNFDVLSPSAGYKFRFTLNWKNSFTCKNGEKVAAKHGLNSPSYNVWKRKPTKAQRIAYMGE